MSSFARWLETKPSALNETAGYIVLQPSGIEASGRGSRTLLDAPHGSIEALSLGKRTTGETLRIVLPQGPIMILRLGHGEGHGIVKSYRNDRKGRTRVVPRPATECKQPLESENLDGR